MGCGPSSYSRSDPKELVTLDCTDFTYKGDVNQLGKPHGKGKYTWSDGDCYEGSFTNGFRDGHGVMTFSNGDKYEGPFHENMYEGRMRDNSLLFSILIHSFIYLFHPSQ